ncbi:glyoxylate/hydroxypyruvate reductase A [Leeuwenhoekiella aestuarii]|uniref:Glyoxylate/hydroxypyruvate reductase A n=1 Tax=Leeuwenhoekiella aestuarii TaxID=2249426 RepID=A0A4Q0P0F8_9FLAO|nr:glyoxylate/hydroxypyruvate reductase A [Leeuwenhoekiella aestuarii]RXG18471.1 glyoxylate/hydroxypyruvate reductase A [Leeuwenhoekiella aestuarii]RXG19776.1 glyoxylate/hydroxypyruvate reductase A [Leeuwenhoekiella aestuarii]
MALLLIRNNKDYQPWIKALQKADPEIELVTPETAKDKSAVTMAVTWKAPNGSFEGYPNLKVIGSMGAGVDHLFNDPSLPKDVTLTRVVDEELASDMQEFVLTLCLNHIKNLPLYRSLQDQSQWKPTQYKRVPDVQIGILGFGTLGQAVGKTLQQTGFQVSGWSHSRKDVEGITSYKHDELDEFLAQAEILVCLLPLTEDTEGILNTALFEKLPKRAYLINVARGGHLVDEDLIAALDSGKLSGAALDVFHTEPLPEDHKFWNRKDILITPHVASMSNAASVAPQIAENYRRMEKGEELKNTVSQDKGY